MKGRADLFVWVEPHYAKTPWYRELFIGLKSGLDAKRQRAAIEVKENPDKELPHGAVLILAGETNRWFYRMLSFASAHGIHVCVASSNPEFISNQVSSVSLDRQKDMNVMVHYLYNAKRRSIALFGINPSSPADQKRSAGYLQTVGLLGLSLNEKDIYCTSGDVSACTDALLDSIDRYDAVISSNDLYAVYLLPRLYERNIEVPRDMYLASFGNTLLSRLSKPSITSATLNHTELGRQAVFTSLYMYGNPHISNMTITIDGDFCPRQSTESIPFSISGQQGYSLPECSNVSSYSDTNLSVIVKLEMFLSNEDPNNIAIVKWLLSDKPLPGLAEYLFLSPSAVDYRLNKLYHHFEVTNRQEFSAIFKRYMDFMQLR